MWHPEIAAAISRWPFHHFFHDIMMSEFSMHAYDSHEKRNSCVLTCKQNTCLQQNVWWRSLFWWEKKKAEEEVLDERMVWKTSYKDVHLRPTLMCYLTANSTPDVKTYRNCLYPGMSTEKQLGNCAHNYQLWSQTARPSSKWKPYICTSSAITVQKFLGFEPSTGAATKLWSDWRRGVIQIHSNSNLHE